MTASNAFGSKILLIGGDDASNTSMMASVLEAQGNTVTTAPAYTAFTGSGLSAYNAVFLLPNGAYYNGVDMPDSGQQALVDYVKNGGGLVTSEAVGDMIQGPGGVHMLQKLAQALPFTGLFHNTANSPVILGQITNDPIMNDQLPSQLVLHPQGYNTEIGYTPKWGATAFFDTNQWTATFGGYGVMAGVVGWNFGSGRVLSLSMFSDSALLADPNYDRLVGNSVRWATDTTAARAPGSTNVPEPSSLLVLGAAGVAFAAASRSRRRACEG
ncbi:MAG: PEP-CTERM sorting domain-containing protein [Paludisphaera borealis]|uniref:PEP-CTERM sorting domain-containing protein n=1 Tax=Paludisphaera borealis TaxID=1387353 RepID=UPI00284FBF42|nr:PEP-CTERM sorting domain-containing protein [Paludisphaera borealis]MDR3622731.1 PEP-CTERM sorting domain-containing protein [Paludisphaera borealis]